MKKNTAKTLACPCGLPAEYIHCCGRWHEGPLYLQAPDALSLMRSRYSAYVLDRLDYLLETWHPDTRPAQLLPNEPGARWLGLDIRRYLPEQDGCAVVEFVARVRVDGRATRLHEISEFVRQDGRWFYRGMQARDGGTSGAVASSGAND